MVGAIRLSQGGSVHQEAHGTSRFKS